MTLNHTDKDQKDVRHTNPVTRVSQHGNGIHLQLTAFTPWLIVNAVFTPQEARYTAELLIRYADASEAEIIGRKVNNLDKSKGGGP